MIAFSIQHVSKDQAQVVERSSSGGGVRHLVFCFINLLSLDESADGLRYRLGKGATVRLELFIHICMLCLYILV